MPKLVSPPTRELVLAKIRTVFPEEQHAVILGTLDSYQGDNAAGQARVHLAVLKLSGGRVERLGELIRTAMTDCRDVLASAESPRQMKLGFTAYSQLGAPERRRLQAEDRADYLDWLREGLDASAVH